jgi:UDP-GlcNAc:undecaprenyl-phosphate GlcNAc-1-phosphate transferase
MTLYVLLFGLALAASLALTPVVRALAWRFGVVDLPDGKRKLHARAVPKLGGVAVFLAFYSCMWLAGTRLDWAAARAAWDLAWTLFWPSILILGLGIVDDRWPVSAWTKIAVQVAAGLVVYYALGVRVDVTTAPLIGPDSPLGVLSLPATLFWIVLITNAFNVVDGMDGLATGVAFIALSCMVAVSLQMGQAGVALTAVALAGAVLGFLRYNFNPASIFLGDSGSLFIGFQLAALSMVGSQKSSTAVAVTAPLFVLALPLIETTTSSIRRFVTGRSIMTPDSGHIHHQLLRLGLTPRRAVGILYLGSGLFGLASLFVVRGGSSANVGMIAVLFFLLTWLAIQRLGYTEFAEINSAVRRFVRQRRIIQNGIVCRKLGDELAEASSIGEAWTHLTIAVRQLGFSCVELNLRADIEGLDRLRQRRWARRLVPAGSTDRETTFAVALRGASGGLGEVVLSRAAAAAPLHSELPILIGAVARGMPLVIEHALAGAPQPAETAQEPVVEPAAQEPVRAYGREAQTHMTCTQCGSSRLHRSRSRTRLEKWWKQVTSKRLHQCPSCHWRGWRLPEMQPSSERSLAVGVPAPPDLSALDAALEPLAGHRR